MKRMLPLLALALAGCATVPPRTAGPTTVIGGLAQVDGVKIRPIAVVEDSRCPMNVRCVWAGRLVILAEIDFSGGGETFRGNLTLGELLPLGAGIVTLVAAVPEKMAGIATRPRDYRFTFAVSRSR